MLLLLQVGYGRLYPMETFHSYSALVVLVTLEPVKILQWDMVKHDLKSETFLGQDYS